MNESGAVAKSLSTYDFHRREKGPTMEGENSMSVLLRGIHGRSPFTISGKPYGVCLAEKLIGEGLIKDHQTVLNIGDGLGYNTAAIQSECEQRQIQVNLRLMDLSPALLQAQRAKNSNIPLTNADAIKMPYASESVDGIILNEVIADFPIVMVDPDILRTRKIPASVVDPIERAAAEEAIAIYNRYSLLSPPRIMKDPVIINTGAIRLLEEASRVLKKGGWIWMSEYGGHDIGYWPKAVELQGHNEWGIKFDHLEDAARKIGFQVGIEPLTHFIGIKSNEYGINIKALDGEQVYIDLNQLTDMTKDVDLKKIPIAILYGAKTDESIEQANARVDDWKQRQRQQGFSFYPEDDKKHEYNGPPVAYYIKRILADNFFSFLARK